MEFDEAEYPYASRFLNEDPERGEERRAERNMRSADFAARHTTRLRKRYGRNTRGYEFNVFLMVLGLLQGATDSSFRDGYESALRGDPPPETDEERDRRRQERWDARAKESADRG